MTMNENMLPNDVLLTLEVARLETRVKELEDVIKWHRSQVAEDRCWMDDDVLYEVLHDGIKCDRRVGCQFEMAKNCLRFIQNRTEGGGWSTYAELEEWIKKARGVLAAVLTARLGSEWMISTMKDLLAGSPKTPKNDQPT